MVKVDLKNSEIDWIGLVPSFWKRDKLFRLCDKMGSGGTPRSTNEDFYGGDIPWIQSGDLTDTYVSETEKKITNEALASSSAKIFPKGTLLVAMYGATIGKLGIMEMDAATNQACCALQLSKKLNSKYAYYLMLDVREYLITQAYGGGQPNISQEILKQLHLFFPPLPEQRAIADYLDKACKRIDSIIDIKQKQLEKIEGYFSSKVKEIISNGIQSKVKKKESGFDWFKEIPEHWKVVRLKSVLSKINSGVTPKGGSTIYVDEGIPLIRSQNVRFEKLDLSDVVCITEDIHNGMSNSKLLKGDVLLNITGASLGRCFYYDSTDEANVNQHVCILRPFQFIRTKFLYYLIRSEIGQAQIFSGFKGSGREGLSFESIKRFRVPLPPKVEQEQIEIQLDTLNNKMNVLIDKLNAQITTLQTYRKSLIHECVTGKKQVWEGEIEKVN